jgi:hypothetical protein
LVDARQVLERRRDVGAPSRRADGEHFADDADGRGCVPFRGGRASSIRSVKITSPTLSLLVIAEKAKRRAELGGEGALRLPDAAEHGRGARVDEQHDRQLALLGVAFHVRNAGARRSRSSRSCGSRPGLVEADLGELHAAPFEGAVILSGEQIRHEVAGANLESSGPSFSCSRDSTGGAPAHLDTGVPDRPQIAAARHLRSDRPMDGHPRKVVRRTAVDFPRRFAHPALAGRLHERA